MAKIFSSAVRQCRLDARRCEIATARCVRRNATPCWRTASRRAQTAPRRWPTGCSRAVPIGPDTCGSSTSNTRQSSSRVNSRTISEPRPRRRFPVHVARAVGRHVVAQRVQIVAAAFAHAFERALQRREESRRDLATARPRDTPALRFSNPRAALSAKIQTGSALRCETHPGDTLRAAQTSSARSAARARASEGTESRPASPAGAAAGDFFVFAASTRRENDGSVNFSFCSSTTARTAGPQRYARAIPAASPPRKA